MSVPDATIRAIHADALRIGFAAAMRAHGVSMSRPGFRYRARRLGLPPISDGWHPTPPPPPPRPRAEALAETLRTGTFRCARCGRDFKFADGGYLVPGLSHRHLVGGADWCTDCYRSRFSAQLRWRNRQSQIDYASPYFRPV